MLDWQVMSDDLCVMCRCSGVRAQNNKAGSEPRWWEYREKITVKTRGSGNRQIASRPTFLIKFPIMAVMDGEVRLRGGKPCQPVRWCILSYEFQANCIRIQEQKKHKLQLPGVRYIKLGERSEARAGERRLPRMVFALNISLWNRRRKKDLKTEKKLSLVVTFTTLLLSSHSH